MAVPALRVLIITMNDRERHAVDLMFDALDWGEPPALIDVAGLRSLEIDRHHQRAQGNLEAAVTVMQSLVGSRFDHVVGYGCCGVLDRSYLGKPLLVAGATYQEVGKVGRDAVGEVTIGLKDDLAHVFDLHAHTEIYGHLAVACDHAGVEQPRQAMVFGVDKVISTTSADPPIPSESVTLLADSTGCRAPMDTYLGRLDKFKTRHRQSYVPIVDMESFGFLRGADSSAQYLSILRIATDALEDKNNPTPGGDTDSEQARLLNSGTSYLLCLLYAIARGGL